MKLRVILGLSLLALAPIAWGQESIVINKATRPVPHAEPTPPNSTEAWLYLQEMRRYEDPAQAVRRKAEAQATQRMERIAALKWYGQSNSRPVASPIPSMDHYSPSWVGNTSNPYQWSGVAQNPRVLYVVPSYVR